MATETLRPNAAGDDTNLSVQFPDSTFHWDKVDEVSHDSDSTYVAENNVDNNYYRDFYNLPAHSGSGAINFIKVYAYIRSHVATATSAKIAIKSGSGSNAPDLVSEGPELDLTWGYAAFSETWGTNPKTSALWTWDEIDTLQIGIALKQSLGGGYKTYCTQVYVEVDYTPPQILEPSAIASAEAFGTAKLNLKVLPSAIASSEAFGTAKLNLTIFPVGIVSAEAFGTLNLLYDQTVIPDGIVSAEAFGTAWVRLGVQYLSPSSIVSAEAFGALTVIPGGVIVSPSAIASLEAFGTAKLVLYLTPTGIASGELFGTPQLNLFITPQGIVSSEGFGEPTILPGGVFVIPSAIASGEAFGTPKVGLYLRPSSIVSLEAFGSPQLNLKLFITAITSAEAFGTPRLGLYLLPSAIASGEAFGTPTILWQLFLLPTSIASAEAFGTPNLYVILTGGDGMKLRADKGQAAIFHE